MSEGRSVSNLNQHESIYGTIMEEPGNLQQIANASSSEPIRDLTQPTLKDAPQVEGPQPEPKYL